MKGPVHTPDPEYTLYMDDALLVREDQTHLAGILAETGPEGAYAIAAHLGIDFDDDTET